jgi:hypothetical protein
MWADAKFRALSSPMPSGKYLWIALLTGPHTTNLPGLFRIGEMALAEELGWPLEGFRQAFTELFREGLASADWSARVVWIPNAIKYNPPDNPNVVKGWRDSWDEVPECSLKAEAYQRLKTFTEGLGEGFAKAFVECCAQGLANQEQEQEQEQEQKPTPSAANATVPDDFDPVDPRHAPVRATIQQLHLKRFRIKCQWDGSEGKSLERLLSTNPSWTEEQILQMVRNRFESEGIASDRPRNWLPNLGSYAAGPQDRFNKLKGIANGNGNGNGKPSVGEIVEREMAILHSHRAQ